MKMFQNPFRHASWLLSGLLIFLLAATAPSCSPRCDPGLIDKVFSLERALPELMEKATKKMPEAESEKVLKSLDEAVAQANATKRNKDAAEMWRLLRDDLVKPYFDAWKTKGKLDADFVKESVKNVKVALTSIQGAETSKRGGCAKSASMPPSN